MASSRESLSEVILSTSLIASRDRCQNFLRKALRRRNRRLILASLLLLPAEICNVIYKMVLVNADGFMNVNCYRARWRTDCIGIYMHCSLDWFMPCRHIYTKASEFGCANNAFLPAGFEELLWFLKAIGPSGRLSLTSLVLANVDILRFLPAFSEKITTSVKHYLAECYSLRSLEIFGRKGNPIGEANRLIEESIPDKATFRVFLSQSCFLWLCHLQRTSIKRLIDRVNPKDYRDGDSATRYLHEFLPTKSHGTLE